MPFRYAGCGQDVAQRVVLVAPCVAVPVEYEIGGHGEFAVVAFIIRNETALTSIKAYKSNRNYIN